MPDQDNQNPNTGSQSDISKSQSQQQPNQASQDREPSSEAERSGDQAQTGQTQSGSADEGLQGDTQTQQRTDVEGTSLSDTAGGQSGETGGEAGSGFVGSQGQQDSSSELVDKDDEKFGKDGQGAPEGK